MTVHHRYCNLCEACCGILIETDGPEILSIRGDEADPLSQGHICPKAAALKDLHIDPDRVRRPLIREGDTWREASWDEAIAAAAAGLHEVQARHGKHAVGSYVGNPSAHHLNAIVATAPWLRLLGSKNRFSASSVDQFPKMLACYLVYGAQLSVAVPDLERTKYLLVLGANPMVSNGSLMTAPGMRRHLRGIKERGGEVVVVDPRRTETARAGTRHLFIRPGTDPLFLLAVLNEIFATNSVNLGAAEGRTDGLEHVKEMVDGFTPEVAAGPTGIPADEIRRIAGELVTADGGSCYTRIGTCVQSYGTLVQYLGDVVNIVAGQLDRPGGAMFPSPAASYSSRGSYKRWQSGERGLPEFGGELPVATMSEEMESDGDDGIRAMFSMAGNPILSTPNGSRLDAAFGNLEFMVSVDPALNETTRHADVILPPRSSLENSQYAIVFHKLAVRDTAKFGEPVFDPAEDSLSEWEIIARLCAELSRLRSEASVAKGGEPIENPAAAHFSATPEQFVELLLASGPYDITLDDLKATPSGIDLGPLKEGGLDHAVRHDDGRIKLAHAEFDAEVARLREELRGRTVAGVPIADASDTNDFLLIGRRQLRSNNSWMHNAPTLMKGRDRCTLLMHDEDAERLGLKHGLLVRVESRVGTVEIVLEVTDEVMPGVVSMPHGFGHNRKDTRMKVASAKPGVSMNDLTDEAVTEGLVGNGILTGVPVRVSAREPASV